MAHLPIYGVIFLAILWGWSALHDTLYLHNNNNAFEKSRALNHHSPIKFDEMSKKMGVTHEHHCFDPDTRTSRLTKIICTPHASVLAVDIDNDGYVDLIFTSPGEDRGLYIYRNLGGNTFQDVTAETGIDFRGGQFVTSALFFDYDNDGLGDLYIVRSGCHSLYKNMGKFHFKDVSQSTGVGNICGFSYAVNALDFDRDGFLDLYIGNYYKGPGLGAGQKSIHLQENSYSARNGGSNFILHNEQGKFFRNVTKAVAPIDTGFTWAIGIADFNSDGWPDLVVAKDYGHSVFLENHNGTFVDTTERSGINKNGRHGMNAEIGDIDNDGHQDIYITDTNMPGIVIGGNLLWKNLGGERFQNIAPQVGVRGCGWGWGAKMADFDNDGKLDIFATNSYFSGTSKKSFFYSWMTFTSLPNFIRQSQLSWIDSSKFSISDSATNCLFHQEDGLQFSDIASEAGVSASGHGKAVAIADFNNDGLMDVVVARSENTPLIYINKSSLNSWIGFHLKGTDAATWGTKVILHTSQGVQLRELYPANGFKAQSDSRIHFGLGEASISYIEIHWADGTSQTLKRYKLNMYQDIVKARTK